MRECSSSLRPPPLGLFFFFKILLAYLREKERESMCTQGEGEREKQTQ